MGVIIRSDSIDTMNLYTDVIKTKTLDNIRLDNAAKMTIQAGKCTILENSKWKLQLDEGGNSQIFQITDNKLSIVPKGWTLDVQSLPGEALIAANSGKIKSSNQWTAVVIQGIEKATLDVASRILLKDTSHIKFIFPNANEYWEDITNWNELYNGMVRYYVGSKRYEHMRWNKVYSVIDGDWYNAIHYGSGMGTWTGRWYDAYTGTCVIDGQIVAGDDSYPTVEITGWYDITFEAELEK